MIRVNMPEETPEITGDPFDVQAEVMLLVYDVVHLYAKVIGKDRMIKCFKEGIDSVFADLEAEEF